MKKYDFDFIKLVLNFIAIFLSIFGLISAYMFYNATILCFTLIYILIIDGVIVILSIIEKDYNTVERHIILWIIWLLCLICNIK